MKKTFLFLFLLCTLYFVLSTSVNAQDFTATKAYSDYQFQLSIYQQDFSDFQDAKKFYTTNPTLQLKEAARQKTLKMLKDRDQLVIVYLTAIRMQIFESKGFDDNQKGVIFGKIDSEIAWYKTHIDKYLTGDDIAGLFTKSDESKDRYTNSSTPIIDEGLFAIGLSQEIGLRIDHQKIYSDLKNYIDEQVSTGKLKIDPFNRWLNDTDAVLQLLQKNEVDGATKIQGLYGQNYGLSSIYNNSIAILTSSIDPLKQLNSYLTEMLASIQNQMK